MAYTDADTVRSELGLTEDQLSDDRAEALIADAEDLIDEALGARAVNENTGRKVMVSEIDGWRLTKLQRAAAKTAARLYKNPGLQDGREWQSESLPGGSVSGPIGTSLANILGDQVVALLNQSGLRRMTTGSRDTRPPWHDFAVNDNSWDAEEVRR